MQLLRAADSDEIDVRDWDAKRCDEMPRRVWSPQQQEVLDAVAAGLNCSDANTQPDTRALFVTGGPGTGKTEVVIQCALDASANEDAVLIPCPVGPLAAAYRKRIPPRSNITVETIHSSFRITRKADEVHVPPGRLRHFDLIIFDETSQQDDHVWTQVRRYLVELQPGPFVVFVGDFSTIATCWR